MLWFKKTFLILAVLGLMIPVFVFADNFGIDSAAQDTDLIQVTQTLPELIGSIIGIALSFVGVIFFLLILYAGFLWMTAFGNDEKVTTAKSIMEHAIIGLVIVLSAYAISKFVFGSLVNPGSQSIQNGGPQNIGGACSDSLTVIECNTQHDDPNTGVPLCKWVPNDPNVINVGLCKDNI